MAKVSQTAVVQINKKAWDETAQGFIIKPCFYRISGLPVPNHLSCASNSGIIGEVKETGIHVTLPKLVKQVFWRDPTDNEEWWKDVRKQFKATRGQNRENALVMLGMSLKEAADPEKIKFSCWEIFRMKIALRDTAWGAMWLWVLHYGPTDLKAIALNSSKRDELWNPTKDGLVAEDITPKDGSDLRLGVYETTETENIPRNVTEVERIYQENLERVKKRKEAEAEQMNKEIDALPVAVLRHNLDGTPLTEAQAKILDGGKVFRPGERKKTWQQTRNADEAMRVQAMDVAERHGISVAAMSIDADLMAIAAEIKRRQNGGVV